MVRFLLTKLVNRKTSKIYVKTVLVNIAADLELNQAKGMNGVIKKMSHTTFYERLSIKNHYSNPARVFHSKLPFQGWPSHGMFMLFALSFVCSELSRYTNLERFLNTIVKCPFWKTFER